MLNSNWEDRKTIISVVEQAKMTSIKAIALRNQLQWNRHLVRMDDTLLLKQTFYSKDKE